METVLNDKHCQLGAKMVDFAGWSMPVQYTSIIQEHLAVRQAAGLFDVSHMGRVLVEGKDAARFLDYLSTNKIIDKKPSSATYTVLCNPEGGCVDDVIVYRQDADHFFLIVNAGNRQKDLSHLQAYAKSFDVIVTDRYQEDGILALQGPKADEIIESLFPAANAIKHMHFAPVSYKGTEIILSRTGYTGSGGFEIYASLPMIDELWDILLKQGKPHGLVPVGLGARDTLRLEMGYALYGHEINDTIAPTESVSFWTVKMDKADFLGKDALKKLESQPTKRTEYGIVLMDRGIAREGYDVSNDEKIIGKVTSGTYSPSLSQAIAIILVQGQLQLGDIVDIAIRGNMARAQVVKIPFYEI